MTDLNIAFINTRAPDDVTALAQIGAAAVLLWGGFSESKRLEMMEIACQITGVQTVSDARERLERLINAHRT